MEKVAELICSTVEDPVNHDWNPGKKRIHSRTGQNP